MLLYGDGGWKQEDRRRKEEKKDEKQDGVKTIVEEKQKELWKERIMERKKGPFY